jgi:hypothetical protein
MKKPLAIKATSCDPCAPEGAPRHRTATFLNNIGVTFSQQSEEKRTESKHTAIETEHSSVSIAYQSATLVHSLHGQVADRSCTQKRDRRRRPLISIGRFCSDTGPEAPIITSGTDILASAQTV